MKLLSTTKVTQQLMVGKQGLSTASHCTIVDRYLERRRSRQDSERAPPEHRDVGCIAEYTLCFLHATDDKYVGQSQSNWKDAFQFCYAGRVIPRGWSTACAENLGDNEGRVLLL